MNYTEETKTVNDETIAYCSYRNLPYCQKPVLPDFQTMNIYVPLAYMQGGTIRGYTRETAPVFFANSVGGYRYGAVEEPGEHRHVPNKANTLFEALRHGYVVASAGIRGRGQDGLGDAPAFIVDYKAAVRYLRHLSDEVPGNKERIITNGTSAGGALSALIGASGNHPDYASALTEIGAYETSDAVYGASCYCPITNLDHADMAYEWQFAGIYEYKRKNMRLDEGGRPTFSNEDGVLSEKEIWVSKEESKLFPSYVNSLSLKDGETILHLDQDGTGSFLDYVKQIVCASAQTALEAGENLSKKDWIVIQNGTVVDIDFTGYVKDITRMKTPPAFDALSLRSPENEVFGSRHFAQFSHTHSEKDGPMARKSVIKMMNPMPYIADHEAQKAKYYRIRHGECDRDTSLAISAILALKLQEENVHVDYCSPWNTPHSGDYDLEELFAWIDEIVQE